MAEHPGEVEEITQKADALYVNLGGISDSKMQAMRLSGRVMLPKVLDAVGVGCSNLRLSFAHEFIQECRPCVIKGNVSEILALCGKEGNGKGVDAGYSHTGQDILLLIKALSQKSNAVIVCTGAVDMIVDGNEVYQVNRGTPMLAKITGTGCVLGALISTFVAVGNTVRGAVAATTLWGICGEKAEKAGGLGQFKSALFDCLGDETIVV